MRFFGRVFLFFLLFLLILFLFSLDTVWAVFSFEIENVNPDSISSRSQEVEVLLKITELPSESYFRVAWQEEEGKPYFGFIKNNNGDWVEIKPLSSDECSNYYYVFQPGNNQITLVTKIGENVDLISGSYILKAHRFTSSCKSNAPSSNIANVNVVLPTSTPTPTLVPTLTPTPTPTPTTVPTEPTATSPPTPGPTATPTPKKLVLKSTSKPTAKVTSSQAEGEVLGEEEESTAFYPWEATEEADLVEELPLEVKKPWWPKLFLVLGIIILFGVSFWFWYVKIRPK